MRIGLGVVLHVKCKDCKEENKIKPYHSHKMGRPGPKIVTLNSRAALAMILTGQEHSHLKADLSILGFGEMTGATFNARSVKLEQQLRVFVRKVAHITGQRRRRNLTWQTAIGMHLYQWYMTGHGRSTERHKIR